MEYQSYTILGFIAATITAVSFLPQAIKTIKTRQTRDISLIMYIVYTIGVILWLIYGILIINFPLILTESLIFIFCSIILFLKIIEKFR